MKSNNRRIRRGWLAAALILSLPVLGHVEDYSGDSGVGESVFSIGPRATYVKVKDADEAKWFVGAQARFRILPALGVEGSVDYYKQEFEGDTIVKVYPVQATLLAYLTPQYPVSPYLLGGAGWYNTRVEGPGGFKDTSQRFGPHAGAGLEAKINEWLSFDGSYRYFWLEDFKSRDKTNNALEKEYQDGGYMVTAALNFHF